MIRIDTNDSMNPITVDSDGKNLELGIGPIYPGARRIATLTLSQGIDVCVALMKEIQRVQNNTAGKANVASA